LAGLIQNPKEYKTDDIRVPTNVRLDPALKVRAKRLAEKKGITLTDLINDLLDKECKDSGEA
jgi:predicted HicB family RNase H-like nuclease